MGVEVRSNGIVTGSGAEAVALVDWITPAATVDCADVDCTMVREVPDDVDEKNVVVRAPTGWISRANFAHGSRFGEAARR